jgi:hypothetical protein
LLAITSLEVLSCGHIQLIYAASSLIAAARPRSRKK